MIEYLAISITWKNQETNPYDFIDEFIGKNLTRLVSKYNIIEGQDRLGLSKNKSLEIDYGYRDGLLETDIFSAYGTKTKQYYFTVKKMGDNSTTLHALSQNTNIKVYDGLNIQLLERF